MQCPPALQTCLLNRLVSDVPASRASHFPKLNRLVPMKRGTYRWEMDPVGPPEAHVQTIYASTYTANKTKGHGDLGCNRARA